MRKTILELFGSIPLICICFHRSIHNLCIEFVLTYIQEMRKIIVYYNEIYTSVLIKSHPNARIQKENSWKHTSLVLLLQSVDVSIIWAFCSYLLGRWKTTINLDVFYTSITMVINYIHIKKMFPQFVHYWSYQTFPIGKSNNTLCIFVKFSFSLSWGKFSISDSSQSVRRSRTIFRAILCS